jgi:Protein of unknown function (DUF732)
MDDNEVTLIRPEEPTELRPPVEYPSTPEAWSAASELPTVRVPVWRSPWTRVWSLVAFALTAVGVAAYLAGAAHTKTVTEVVVQHIPSPAPTAPKSSGPKQFDVIQQRDVDFWNKVKADHLPFIGDVHDADDPGPMRALVIAHNICDDEQSEFHGNASDNASDLYTSVTKGYGWTYDQTQTLVRDSIAAYCPQP